LISKCLADEVRSAIHGHRLVRESDVHVGEPESSLKRIGYPFLVETAGAYDPSINEHKRQFLTRRQCIECSFAFGTYQTVQIGFLEAEFASDVFLQLCLQNLETPLQRKLSSSTFGEYPKRRLKRITAVSPTTSTTGFRYDLHNDF
jgi:hypothetical protein